MELQSVEPNYMRRYTFPDDDLEVTVTDHTHERVAEAEEIEVATFVALDDPEEETRGEFDNHRHNSMYILVEPSAPTSQESPLIGMGRIITADSPMANKTLTDLADIPEWQHGVPKARKITHENGKEVELCAPEIVIDRFLREAACEDLSKVWDIATMAIDPKFSGSVARAIALAIVRTMNTEAIMAWRQGKITHCTAFTQVRAHKFLTKSGIPFHNMFGLAPMMYDNQGSERGMIAQPAWLRVEDLAAVAPARGLLALGSVALGRDAA